MTLTREDPRCRESAHPHPVTDEQNDAPRHTNRRRRPADARSCRRRANTSFDRACRRLIPDHPLCEQKFFSAEWPILGYLATYLNWIYSLEALPFPAKSIHYCWHLPLVLFGYRSLLPRVAEGCFRQRGSSWEWRRKGSFVTGDITFPEKHSPVVFNFFLLIYPILWHGGLTEIRGKWEIFLH